ncbi:MAG: prepilin peptidase [Candidatus Magnetoovum sp. WYHC-5]|nr:prepilin peptidase [Candidatus Magnetoovum sp. WYHC-5]
MYIVVALLFGLIVGSFLNVCIYRLPREGMSIVKPRSSCPFCKQPIKPWHNIPVLSYILLRGKCAYCKTQISMRYPIVELMNGIIYTFCIYKFGLHEYTILYMALASALIVVTFIDLEFMIIPDRITLAGIIIGLIASSFILINPHKTNELLGITGSLIGLFTGGGIFYIIALISRGGMGGGDIKMMAMVGSILGWQSVLMTMFIGSLLGTLYGLPLMIFKGKGRKTKIPFGPFLAAGTLLVMLFGKELLHVYLN